MRMTKDEHADFKRVFMKIADDYVKSPSPKKEKALGKLVKDVLQKDPQLLTWFNTMFNWRNREDGIQLAYAIKPKFPF